MSFGPDSVLMHQIADLERRIGMLERALIGVLAGQPPSPTQTLSGPLPGPALTIAGPIAGPTTPPSALLIPPEMPEWFPVLHKDPRCAGTAQYVTRQLRPDEPPNRALLRVFLRTDPHPEWRVPTPNEIARCATCSEPIDPHSDADLDWSGVIVPFVVGEPVPLTASATAAPITAQAEAEQQRLLSEAMKAARAGGFGHVLDDLGYDAPK